MDTQCWGFLAGTTLKHNIIEVLRMTRWKETIQGPGMSGAKLKTLTKYLCFDWLAGMHVADQIHAMYDDLCSSSWDCESPHLLVDLEFSSRILEAYESHEQYAIGANYTFLWKVEHDLSHGLIESVGGLIHINGNHYIAFILDAAAQSIHFSNPMHNPIPAGVQDTFLWWFRQLLEEGQDREGASSLRNGPVEVVECSLPVTRQRDNNSCAVLSLNALMHHYTPDVTPLLPTSDKNALVLE